MSVPRKPEPGQLVVIMPHCEWYPDRDRADTHRIWWILAAPGDDPAIQIGRIYKIDPAALDSLPLGGYGAEFCTQYPTPPALYGVIVPPVETYDEMWIEVRDRLLAVGAYPVHRRFEQPANTPPTYF